MFRSSRWLSHWVSTVSLNFRLFTLVKKAFDISSYTVWSLVTLPRLVTVWQAFFCCKSLITLLFGDVFLSCHTIRMSLQLCTSAYASLCASHLRLWIRAGSRRSDLNVYLVVLLALQKLSWFPCFAIYIQIQNFGWNENLRCNNCQCWKWQNKLLAHHEDNDPLTS